MRFYVLDGRQYRSLYPGGVGTGPDSPARHAESQTMLGRAAPREGVGGVGAGVAAYRARRMTAAAANRRCGALVD